MSSERRHGRPDESSALLQPIILPVLPAERARRSIPARDVAAALRAAGLSVAGTTEADSVWVTRFAWVERPD